MKNNKLKKIISYISKTIMLTMIVFILFLPAAIAESEAKDITDTVIYDANNGMWAGSTVDDNYGSYWYTNDAAYKYLQIESEKPISSLYVCYAFKPTELAIQISEDGDSWTDYMYEYPDEFYNKVYEFENPVSFIRIRGTEESKGKFGIVEFKTFTEGALPDYVQIWEPTYDTCDMLIISAHPDDEAVFFSGLIPYYGGEQGKKIITVYMAVLDPSRRSEALNYQWTMHQTHLPIFGPFEDVYEMDKSSYTRSIWGEQETLEYLVTIIRQKKPKVIVSHDLEGEYGHGAHIFTASCLRRAVVLAADPKYHTESYEAYGTYEVKKLYLHLYDEHKIHMDVFDEPLEAYNGLTAIQAARNGLLQYASQLKFEVVRVHDKDSNFSCYDYGLAYTTVGHDTKGNDMFENIEPEPTPEPSPSATPFIEDTPSPTPAEATAALAENPEKINLSPAAKIFICVAAGIIFLVCVLLIITIAKK